MALGYPLRMVIQSKASKQFEGVIEKVGIDKLADKLGVSVSTIRNYRTGVAVPDLEIAFKIEDAYKIPPRLWLAT
jgi:transcriptional regulator with XRE-family HTH domain